MSSRSRPSDSARSRPNLPAMKRVVAAALVAFVTLTASADAKYRVTVKRSAHGIPHIIARDFPSIAYGYAQAEAEDNICVLADTYVTVRGERSKYFGPDGTYQARGNGTVPH